MTLFDRLVDAAGEISVLEKFLSRNAAEIIDWFNQLPHDELKSIQGGLKKLVLLNFSTLQKLTTNNNNLAFLLMLMEKAEQLGEVSVFRRLYRLIKNTGFEIGSRLYAAALYMDIPNDVAEYVSIFDEMYLNLYQAYLEEEDSSDKVIFTIVNYYLQVIDNCGEFNPAAPERIRRRMGDCIKADKRSFLNCPLIYDVLDTNLDDVTIASIHIRSLLDLFLERALPIIASDYGLLVEEETDYSYELKKVLPNFLAIRKLSVAKHMANPDSQKFYDGLQRGVKILDDERELYAYMVAMGKMHREKLNSALESFDFTMLAGNINIIDWGCGQGTATMVLFDYLESLGISLDISNIVLIEPSGLALRRGGLHTLKFDNTVRLVTINDLLGGVTSENLKDIKGTTIHLFANILDIDAVALKPLTNLIRDNISGNNLFICTSPYINGAKNHRLDSFLSEFNDNNLTMFMKEDNAKGTWINGWSRVVRVFSASIP